MLSLRAKRGNQIFIVERLRLLRPFSFLAMTVSTPKGSPLTSALSPIGERGNKKVLKD